LVDLFRDVDNRFFWAAHHPHTVTVWIITVLERLIL